MFGRKRSISLDLHAFRQRYITPKRGERAKLKREYSRLCRQEIKLELRAYVEEDWTAGTIEDRELQPRYTSSGLLVRSCLGDRIFLS